MAGGIFSKPTVKQQKQKKREVVHTEVLVQSKTYKHKSRNVIHVTRHTVQPAQHMLIAQHVQQFSTNE